MHEYFEQLKSMVIFAQVVEQQGFSAAAKHLGLSRAVVSYHVKKLESQHAVKLLNRSTRSMSLTEAGKNYYQKCRVIAEQAHIANQQLDNLKHEPEGLVKITCPVNAGLELIVPALNEFKRQYPKIELDLTLTDEVIDLVQQGVDLAIRGAALKDSELKATHLANLSTHLCASPAYLQHSGRPTCHKQLERHKWVVYTQGIKTVNLRKDKQEYKVKPKGEITINNAAARTAFVEAGHGLGRIPFYQAWPRVQAGALELLLTDYQLDDISIYAVFPPGATSSKKLRLVIDYLKDYFDRLQKQKILTA